MFVEAGKSSKDTLLSQGQKSHRSSFDKWKCHGFFKGEPTVSFALPVELWFEHRGAHDIDVERDIIPRHAGLAFEYDGFWELPHFFDGFSHGSRKGFFSFVEPPTRQTPVVRKRDKFAPLQKQAPLI